MIRFTTVVRLPAKPSERSNPPIWAFTSTMESKQVKPQFIRRADTLINPTAVAVAVATGSVGPITRAGTRGVVLRDSRGIQVTVVGERDIEGLPGFVRLGDLMINTLGVALAEKTPEGLKLRAAGGHVIATVDETAFLAALGEEVA
jgi:hypothetical protein